MNTNQLMNMAGAAANAYFQQGKHNPSGGMLAGDGNVFNHAPHANNSAHYDQLREQARHAYDRGDHATGANYNKQASEYIFRENNAPGRVAADTIDLHGQFVHEAEDILRTRIRAAKAQGDDHLHVIVGKGIHSQNHVPKLKPAVEQMCADEGLSWKLEHNEGRIFVDLRGANQSGGAGGYMPHEQPHYQQQHHQQQHGGGQGRPHGKPQHQMQQDQQEQKQQDPLTACIKSCCTVM